MSDEARKRARYLTLLRESYDRALQPTVREVADRAGLGRVRVDAILTGSIRPSRCELVLVAQALSQLEREVGAFWADMGASPPADGPRRPWLSRDVAQAIRAGTADIAAAIREAGRGA